MFNKADPANNLKRVRATLKTRSGESETGAILIPAHRTLREALNDEGPFIEMESEDGRLAFLLKTEVAARRSAQRRRIARLRSAPGDSSRFDANDARLVLGVARRCDG